MMLLEVALEVELGCKKDLGYQMIHGKTINKLWENLILRIQ
jgi:hypothetical protein